MRYPNTRYGHHSEFEFWMQGHSIQVIAKRLKRSERSVHDWLTGKRKIPWWVPEILRLQHYEYYDRLRQMGFNPPRRRLAVATADVLAFPKPVAVISSESGASPLLKP
ncbi:hypothetical protein ACIPEN_13190 [Herbaspirillum chlorophenolicum]|uniref:Helix-turn-helix domain-containing protein n=1 Tax=Herbaspirillum chlorophenolicum TaxID=211589 RepID=A0ABW8F0G2_9BURK